MGGATDDSSQINGEIMVISMIICNVMSSSEEEKCGALLYNYKELRAISKTLKDMGHTPRATEIITENSTADRIMRGTTKKKRTKSIDMRFNWVHD